jgi:HEAT repeat protein
MLATNCARLTISIPREFLPGAGEVRMSRTERVFLAFLFIVVLAGAQCASSASRQGRSPAGPGIPEEVAEEIERLFNKGSSTRAFAARRLGEMGEKAAGAIPHLVRLLSDNSSAFLPPYGQTYSSSEAQDALVKIGKPSVEPLMEVLNDDNPHVRHLAAEALIKIGDL